MNLLPFPRSLKRQSGIYTLPARAIFRLDAPLPQETIFLAIGERLQSAVKTAGAKLEIQLSSRKSTRPHIFAAQGGNAPKRPGAYAITVQKKGIAINYRDLDGLHASVATMRQLLREFGLRLPYLSIRDYPDFPKRGVMLDISRGRVPNLKTLMELASHLADFKINEFQLYTEHTFAYRNYKPVWKDWGALTGDEILQFDAYCQKLGIELVPNQNSFGHLRYWLAYPPLKKLAEIQEAWPDQGGTFVRQPATLAPNNPGTLPFLRELYDELLPNFTSNRFNVGCDETWDLGRGQSKALCDKLGKGRVYVDFLKKIYRETKLRKKQMLFWGDIILHHPELVKELPKDIVAINWGYEAGHPFDKEGAIFSKSKIPYYVCPGTSTWMSLIGRHDNAFANLTEGARIGRKHGAIGYLNTDWGDGGHLQPLAVSYLLYLLGAAVSWCEKSYKEKLLVPVLNRDVFQDPTGNLGKAAFALGFAHQEFKYTAPNISPFGATLGAAPPEQRELFCRDGLKYYARIPAANIKRAQRAVERQLGVIKKARPAKAAKVLATELDLAARMAAQSCKFMLWQQSLAKGKSMTAKLQSKIGVRELQKLQREFMSYWKMRNKGTPARYWPCMKWRINDYRRGKLPFPPELASVVRVSTSGD